MLVGPAGEVDLERESLLEAIAALDVDGVDAVQRLFREPDDVRILRRDLAGHLERGLPQLLLGYDLENRAVLEQLLRRGGTRRVDHRPHEMRRDEPSQVRSSSERSAINLGEAEGRVITGDDDVSIADESDAAAEAETVDRGEDRDRTLVHRGERGVTTPICADERAESGGALHFLDVDARVEAATRGGEHDAVDALIAACADEGIGEVEPPGDGERIDRRVVDDDLGDRTVPIYLDTHRQDRPSRPSACLVTYQPVTGTGSIDYAGRGVLVTGGGRGIGRGITEAFLASGAEVVVCARHEPAELPSVTTPSGTRTASFVLADIRDPEAAAALVDTAAERLGRLDVVVNNAGGGPALAAATASPRVSTRIIELNLLAPLHVSQRANTIMQAQPEGGSIIMISSISGARPSPGSAVYGAAKAGLTHLARSLAIEWAPKVRVNTLVVGLVASENADDHYGGAAGSAAVARTVPMLRMGTAEDVAGACLFLGSDLAGFITGAALSVHGGGEKPEFLAVVKAALAESNTPATKTPTDGAP